jgi:hypothetical protein
MRLPIDRGTVGDESTTFALVTFKMPSPLEIEGKGGRSLLRHLDGHRQAHTVFVVSNFSHFLQLIVFVFS